MQNDITLDLADEAATLALGERLSKVVAAGMAIYLHGNLGAGKTTLVRGLLHAMGHAGTVKSPTYTLVEPYTLGQLTVYHFDLYRFADPEEWDEAGFRDYFNPLSLCLVEWPEQAGDLLPPPDIDIRISPQADGRKASLIANTTAGMQCLERFS